MHPRSLPLAVLLASLSLVAAQALSDTTVVGGGGDGSGITSDGGGGGGGNDGSTSPTTTPTTTPTSTQPSTTPSTTPDPTTTPSTTSPPQSTSTPPTTSNPPSASSTPPPPPPSSSAPSSAASSGTQSSSQSVVVVVITSTAADGSLVTSSSSSVLPSASSLPENSPPGGGGGGSNTGKTWGIVGGVVGGLVVLAGLALVVWRCTQRRFSDLDDDDVAIKWPELVNRGEDPSTLNPMAARQGRGHGVGDDEGDEEKSSYQMVRVRSGPSTLIVLADVGQQSPYTDFNNSPQMLSNYASPMGHSDASHHVAANSVDFLTSPHNGSNLMHSPSTNTSGGGGPGGYYDPYLGPSAAPQPYPPTLAPAEYGGGLNHRGSYVSSTGAGPYSDYGVPVHHPQQSGDYRAGAYGLGVTSSGAPESIPMGVVRTASLSSNDMLSGEGQQGSTAGSAPASAHGHRAPSSAGGSEQFWRSPSTNTGRTEAILSPVQESQGQHHHY